MSNYQENISQCKNCGCPIAPKRVSIAYKPYVHVKEIGIKNKICCVCGCKEAMKKEVSDK